MRIVWLAAIAACTEPSPRPDPAPRSAPGAVAVPESSRPAATAAPAPPPLEPPALAGLASCDDSTDVAIFASPRAPRPGRALRVLAVASHPIDAVLAVHAPDGTVAVLSRERRGASPYFWSATIPEASAGTYRAALGSGSEIAACDEFRVGDVRRTRDASDGAWSAPWSWERDTENLYSAWIEGLFDDPLEAQPSWHGLSEVLADPARNFLHDHLGLGEDAIGRHGLGLEPDCADLPFFLRAYFAWKVGLPFGWSDCTRGGRFGAPRCSEWHSSDDVALAEGGDVERFERFLKHDVAWAIHSGSARTTFADDETDLYPIRLSAETLRPGTVYADPYGHTLVVVRRIPQTADAGGLLLAVDAQPDGTVARKRYWRGNFLFAIDPSLGGAGFKHFRPIARRRGALEALSNREIEHSDDYGDYGIEQASAGVEGFYDRVDDVLSPSPLDPSRALQETIQALDEQIRTRIQSVANGEAYAAEHPGTIRMPEGAEIFETTGAWEDYSTPARDLRILIAIDVVEGFADRVLRRPERWAMPAGKSAADVRADLDAILAEESASRRFVYRRSDGSDWTLTIADVRARKIALEVAYDPNDCVEVRWGAPSGSPESSTCRRHAPADQVARMAQARAWFHERRRPPRD